PYLCRSCPVREQCTQSKSCQKTVTRHIWADYIERAEDVRHSPLGKETYSQRSRTIERVFADAKEKHGMRYTTYRGLSQVTNWVRLKFAAMNLKKLANWRYPTPLFRHLFSAISIFQDKTPSALAC
ncbi:MAG: transposase, partial [Oscillospiraceae bacterium]